MAIDKDEVKNIAKLGRLKLTDKEVDYFSSQLGRILEYIEQLKELDVSAVEPTSHILSIKNVFHEDRVRPSLSREDALANAPDKEAGFFKVPRII